MRVAIFKRPPRAQFLTKSKNFCGHQIENCLKILLDFEIFEKGHSKPELRMIKVWSQIIVLFAMFYTNPSLFLAFTVFTSIVYFFWLFPFQPPPFENPRLQPGLVSNFWHRPTFWIFLGGLNDTLYSYRRISVFDFSFVVIWASEGSAPGLDHILNMFLWYPPCIPYPKSYLFSWM